MRSTILRSVFACLCAATATATGLPALDLRLGYDVVGTGEDAKANGTTSDFSWNHADRYTLDAVFSSDTPIIGLLAGVGVALDERSKDSNDGTVQDRSYYANVEAGIYGTLVPELLRVELLPFVGIGRSRLDASSAGVSSGRAEEYGVNLNLVLHVPELPVAAGVGVGLIHTQSNQSLSSGSYDLHDHDAMVGAFVAVIF
jgi:hypothetical protein